MSAERDGRSAFYGRRVGKTLGIIQKDAVARVLPRFLMDLDSAADPSLLFAGPVEDVHLEIGFGGGEHLLNHAARRPATGFIGVEPFLNGMARLLVELDQTPLGNIRLFNDDAALLLQRLPAASLSATDLLYPDPWPKRRHWKRRFVRADNLDLLARAIRPGGLFRFASDVPHYVGWTLREVRAHGAFSWTAECAEDWLRPYPHWPGTRYEAKALAEGRLPTYLTFQRV